MRDSPSLEKVRYDTDGGDGGAAQRYTRFLQNNDPNPTTRVRSFQVYAYAYRTARIIVIRGCPSRGSKLASEYELGGKREGWRGK
jgi:hypothetical protein